MIKYSVLIRVYKYSKFKWEDEKEFEAEDKEEAKEIAKNFETSNDYAMDLTVKVDLRTLKQIKN